MGCGTNQKFGRWGRRMRASCGGEHREHYRGSAFSSSGNAAFDEYREATIKRLEDEEREFRDFLERLRLAKDRAEFDEFMKERKSRAAAPPQSGNGPETFGGTVPQTP